MPVGYYFADGSAYCHSLPGLKIHALRKDPRGDTPTTFHDDLRLRDLSTILILCQSFLDGVFHGESSAPATPLTTAKMAASNFLGTKAELDDWHRLEAHKVQLPWLISCVSFVPFVANSYARTLNSPEHDRHGE